MYVPLEGASCRNFEQLQKLKKRQPYKFHTILYPAIVEETNITLLKRKCDNQDLMSDKEWRLDREHMRCKCGGGEVAWRLEREGGGVRNPPDLTNTHPLNTTLQPIPEGEEGEDRHELANLVLVRQGERVHETGVTGDQPVTDGHQVFL